MAFHNNSMLVVAIIASVLMVSAIPPAPFYNSRTRESHFSESDSNQPNHLSAGFNRTWGLTVGSFYPGHEVADEPVRVRFDDFVKTNDESIFVLSSTYTDLNRYQEYGIITTYQYLQKYDSSLNRIWTRRNINMSRGEELIYEDGHLYSVGFLYSNDSDTDVLVTKWKPNGEKVWQHVWDGGSYEYGVAIAVENESIFVIAEKVIQSYPATYGSALLRLSIEGELLWNKTHSIPVYHDSPYYDTELVIHDEKLYLLTDVMSRFDLDGNLEWQKLEYTGTADAWVFDGEAFYAVGGTFWPLVRALNSAGSEIWNSSFPEHLSSGRNESYCIHDFALKPSGNLVFLVYAAEYEKQFKLIEYRSTGQFVDETWVGEDYWPHEIVLSNHLLFLDEGAFYIGHEIMAEQEHGIAIEAYNVEGRLPYLSETILIIGIAAVVLVLSGIAYRIRKD